MNSSAPEFNPFMKTQWSVLPAAPAEEPQISLEGIEARANAFLDIELQRTCLSAHDLLPEDISLLWEHRRPLAEEVIKTAHKIFMGFRTNYIPIPDKLNKEGETWKTYRRIVLLGANPVAGEDQCIPAQELLMYAALVKFISSVDLEKMNSYLMHGVEQKSRYSMYLYGACLNNKAMMDVTDEKTKTVMRECLEHRFIARFPLALYQRAQLELVEGDLKKYRRRLVFIAKRGLATAQFDLSVNYLRGVHGCKPKRKMSATYLDWAFNQGYVPAINNKGYYHFHGLEGQANREEAYELFRRAALQGSTAGLLNYAYCLRHGYGCEMNPEEADRYQEKAKGKTVNSNELLVSEPPPAQVEPTKKDLKILQRSEGRSERGEFSRM